MDTPRWLVRILIFVTMFAALVLSPGAAAAQGGVVADSVTSSPYGTFNGVDYIQYTGRFEGTATGAYSAFRDRCTRRPHSGKWRPAHGTAAHNGGHSRP